MRQKSQLALSATEGGVNKGIACLFMSRGGGGWVGGLPVCSIESEMDADIENHLSARPHCRGTTGQKQAFAAASM